MSPPAKPPPTSSPHTPLIPERFLDAPSQRLYYLSLGLLCQAIKILDITWHWASGADNLSACKKWLLVDFIYVVLLRQLRIPRLTYGKSVILLQIASLWFLDGLFLGGITVNAPWTTIGGSQSTGQYEYATPESTSFLDLISPLTLGLISSRMKDAHLQGQHTVRMSPISTARLNPYDSTFCLNTPSDSVLIPILLNNTNVAGLRYLLTPLDLVEGRSPKKSEYIELSAKDLKAIEQSRLEALQVSRLTTSSPHDSDEYDEYDDDDDEETRTQDYRTKLQNTQSLVHIRVSKPGILRVLRVFDVSNTDAHLITPAEVLVVPCPRAQFIDDAWKDVNVRCAGQDQDVRLMISVNGHPPLSLRWLKIVNGKREHFLVEGIEGGHDHSSSSRTSGDIPKPMDHEKSHGEVARRSMVPQELKVPLTVPLDAVGTYVYALEEVTDGVGNVVSIESDVKSVDGRHMDQSAATRSLMVLRRPTFSFRHCGPERPTSLLIGSQAPLTIAAHEADDFDAPWEVDVSYLPQAASDNDTGKNKHLKPWKKTLKSSGHQKELTFMASNPGEYTILGVKGRHCPGDILAPETCRVIQKPLPSAEIQWKRIHECSGDTGVSASLVLRGTPPFQVYYRVQRDNEPPVDYSKTFATARGELTLQPERSGHYTFSFFRMSDTNYKKVELQGPSIDQVVHPLAAADFVTDNHDYGRNKRTISSCSGSIVDIDVELRGTGPWSLEVQVIGPKSSETKLFDNIDSPKKTLQIPIPKDVDKEGGPFEIDILSVEDAYKCKRPLSVPGVSVDVRRIKPTARFYGLESERHITVLETGKAALPLRLTGEGPWRVKYRHTASNKILNSVVTSPNAHLQVADKGTYELLEISDSKCLGTIIPGDTTYNVIWVPRPSAKLSTGTNAFYESYNGSHILPPICEGVDDHVDLDLSGRPPFQIMYNIAQGLENGGTKVLGQPTFNSIQPKTRFQLQTGTPGRIFYEVKQVGDAAYPLSKHRNTVIPRSERLIFEQQVSQRPSAHFRTRSRLAYCLNDVFVPAEQSPNDGLLVLEGTPPFKLTLSIKDISASQTELRTVEVYTHSWHINLPSYIFKSIGPHLVSVESVVDASNCAQMSVDPLSSFIWVDVVENAAIIPFDRRLDYCVGEITQFQLEGIPPWTISYTINDKPYTQHVSVSPFSLLQQQSGEFAITAIAHQQKLCKASVTDVKLHIHPLPSAQVGHGKRVYQDIHEGDQAEIVFTLIGEPPFTFTYQRSEASPKKGGKPGKVLETHTVSRVTTHEYSIFSALEGTWTVTSISDKYCRYPPAVPDGGVGKH
ncbi:hypothetical protein AMATHDRAFT_146737 [Amanita thiersii Skay4041]|uniref:Nucleoporin Pom152 n=1 Tax=Amanita thiersii Skay4041 TaxID=703135 RepID=A0A2A9NIB5_9AGAR|nr:hypothetical protein AMATHDRAFT_146737 [Amanita thiersii Skay4041]